MKTQTPVIINDNSTATIVVKHLLAMVAENVGGIHQELYRKLSECVAIIKRDFDRSADGDTLTIDVRLLEFTSKTPPMEGGSNMEETTQPTPTNNPIDIGLVAMVCHETNRAWCAANGDHSQLPWHDAPQWQRDSAILGVQYRIANPNAPEDAQHNSWMDAKIKDGWKYGPVKDAEKKEHPCMVPFEQLPIDQQIKDKLFCAVVDAILRPKQVFENNVMQASPVEMAPLTFGQKAAGVGFNPGKNPTVDLIKNNVAELIDIMHDYRQKNPGEAARYASTAITNFETAKMLAVKAVTWQH